MIDRIRLTATAKNQLIVLKRRTGIQHYNSLCRHALCISLANSSPIPDEELSYSGGLEIEWRVIAGDLSDLFIDLIKLNLDQKSPNHDSIKSCATTHIHRGLSYLFSKSLDEITQTLG